MRSQELIATAKAMVAADKGLLAMDESISGAILYDETIRQQIKDGAPFVKAIQDAGIVAGIKVDTGAKPLARHPPCHVRGQPARLPGFQLQTAQR